MNDIATYVITLVESLGMSLRGASLACGLAPETLGKIVVRGDSKPNRRTLRAIADRLGGDFDTMMRLAGHWPSVPPTIRLDDDHDLTPEDRALVDRVLRMWRDADPETRQRLMNMARMQAELVQGALRAREREKQEQEQNEIVTE